MLSCYGAASLIGGGEGKVSQMSDLPQFFSPGPVGYSASIGFNRAVIERNYAVVPPQGILESYLPAYRNTIVRFQTAPVMGARFAQALLEIAADGGAKQAERAGIEQFFLVLEGEVELVLDHGRKQRLRRYSYAYLPSDQAFSLYNLLPSQVRVLMLQRRYQPASGFDRPEIFFSHIDEVPRNSNAHSVGRSWQHLLPQDMRFDMEMNVLSFMPGTHFPAIETHIMEHGLYMLKGQGLYFLEKSWHEVWREDFIWMGSYVPQQFFTTGSEEASYLLYKDVNRDVPL